MGVLTDYWVALKLIRSDLALGLKSEMANRPLQMGHKMVHSDREYA